LTRTYSEIKEAYKQLCSKKTEYGSYKKSIFHIHTPASYDFTLLNKWDENKFNRADETEILELCIENKIIPKGFDFKSNKFENEDNIFVSKKEFLSYLLLANELLSNKFEIAVVCDHHTFSGVKKLEKCINELKTNKHNFDIHTRVFSGIEVSCADRLHVVGIFKNNQNNLEKIEKWLNDNLISEIEGVFLTSYDVMNFFDRQGGITYIAHINSSDIFKKEKFLSGGYKKKLLSCDYSNVVGISNIDQKDNIENLMKNFNANIKYVIDNDSHNIDLLNKNYFWIKGSKINFRMLKEAFIDFDISIEYKYKPFSKKYIKGIYIQHTDDGFLTNGEINEGPFCIKFSDSLNAFIGGRGTGKSTILEFMDYIMGQNCRTEKLLDFLCNHGNAYILYVDNKKEYIIELLTPSKKNEHILQLFGQNHENKYHYRYHYDIEEIKERTLKTYINIYVLEYRKKEAPYFTPVTNKRKILEKFYDTRYSVNELVRVASSDKITEFIYKTMFRNKELESADKYFNKRSLKGLKNITYNFNNILSKRNESVYEIITPFNQIQQGILKIIYKQKKPSKDPPLKKLLNIEMKKIEKKYNITSDRIIDFLLSIFDRLGVINLLKKSFDYNSGNGINELEIIKYAEDWDEKHIEDSKIKIDEKNASIIVKELIKDLASENNYILWIEYLKEYYSNIEKFSIEFNVNSKETDRTISTNFKDIQEISLGQKVVAMLDFVFGYGDYIKDNRPLIIDQPEDNLDSQYIYKNLVMQLRKIKGKRQVIMATHNATIVTNAMTECVFVMKSDGKHGWVLKQGYPGDKKIKKSIINHMEGGIDSFKHKSMIYDEIIKA
jgi:predicted ATPase